MSAPIKPSTEYYWILLLICCCNSSADGDAPAVDAANQSHDLARDLSSSEPVCLAPDFPRLGLYPVGATLRFEAEPDAGIEVGLTLDLDVTEPETWLEGAELLLPDSEGTVRVFARAASCATITTADIQLVASFPGAAETEGADAVEFDDPGFVGWTSTVASVVYGSGVDAQFRTPDKALGPSGVDTLHVLCLGNGGVATLELETTAFDGPGADFVVFENGVTDAFLELAFVEVSSDGTTWVRFSSAYLGTTPVPGYGPNDATLIEGLAGKYRLGFGTPFDLATLATRPGVQGGEVNLSNINFIRIVDIIGDGATLDSFGNPIYDPTPTFGSGGFDLDAIGVLNGRP